MTYSGSASQFLCGKGKQGKNFFPSFKIQAKLTCNIVLVSGIQQSDSVIYMFFRLLGNENLIQHAFHKDLWKTCEVSALL